MSDRELASRERPPFITIDARQPEQDRLQEWGSRDRPAGVLVSGASVARDRFGSRRCDRALAFAQALERRPFQLRKDARDQFAPIFANALKIDLRLRDGSADREEFGVGDPARDAACQRFDFRRPSGVVEHGYRQAVTQSIARRPPSATD